MVELIELKSLIFDNDYVFLQKEAYYIMRKQIFKQITEILSTIMEGVMFATTAKPDEAYTMLCDCYDASNAISETLNGMLNEKRILVYNKWILALIDMLEDLNEHLANGKPFGEIFRGIENQIHLIRSAILSEKIEIVFMPYSASMWDCMESIWEAARKDPNCECIVVPIPYYERNIDNSFGKFHYEGSQFPKNVPITNYEAYDYTTRKPDIVYIHNPYDGYNRVTSVDPRFYSSELKKYTEMLVYVPYYVTNGTVPESHCRVPALQFIDKVIVQSDETKEQHEKTLPSEKVVPLGSPKVDRILHLEKNKPEIPEEWKEIIGNKKVVLFNLSITSLLAEGNKALEKLSYVFSIFEERDDVVLLWRPHPLSSNTMSSMRPQLLQGYQKLVNDFREKRLGIFDDTPDVERAIAISDAYFGDGTSSLVHMFSITGKPAMVQELNINREPDEEDLHSVWFGSAEFDGDRAWFSLGSFNGLCQVNLHTGQVEFVSEIPNERRYSHLLYEGIVKHENKLILAPLGGKEIAEFDLIQGSFKKITRETSSAGLSVGSFQLFKNIVYKESVYFTPLSYPAILKYDLRTGENTFYTDWMDQLSPFISDSKKPLFANGVCVRDNLLLMAFAQDNIVLEFNMDTNRAKFHRVGREGNKYWGMTFDGQDYWLIQNDNRNAESIVKWNYETGATEEYADFPPGFVSLENNFNEIVYCGKYLLAFPRFSNMIVKIDATTGAMSEFNTGLDYKEGERKSCYNSLKCNYYFAKRYDEENVIAMSMYDNSLIKININTEEVTKVKMILKKEDIKAYISFDQYCNNAQEVGDFHFTESKYLSLNNLLDYIASDNYSKNPLQSEKYAKVIKNADGTCGMKTHQYIMGNLT
ncbi:hypothetical protein [Brevibacillus centrosporus]|uniref:hypothetical protein n=1 Tax=Brevibacillus centrosporus TaxID=54910 RepID=UPI002E20D70D|nr:hypothetical protein [Brevibacillus centrosporus]